MRAFYLWRKQATHEWLELHLPELEAEFAANLATIERAGRKRATVEVCCASRSIASDLVGRFGGRFERVPRDWQKRYAQNQPSKALKIGARLIIDNVGGAFAPRPRPPAAAKESGRRGPSHIKGSRRALVVPAGAAFGTGDHATTAMSLRLLEQVSRGWSPGWSLLDAGTGSGILALAGRCFGARTIVAVDFDQLAISTAKQNARRNGIRGIRFTRGDILQWRSAKCFDVIAANLFSELLIKALPIFRKSLRANGHLILSGILREQTDDVLRAARGFDLRQIRQRGKWSALYLGNGL